MKIINLQRLDTKIKEFVKFWEQVSKLGKLGKLGKCKCKCKCESPLSLLIRSAQPEQVVSFVGTEHRAGLRPATQR